MRYVIVGAGRVGMRTARALREEGHEVVIVDPDQSRVDRLRQEGVDAIQGDGSREDLLRSLDLADVDGLGALSGDILSNYVACMIADHHGCRTVMRVDDDYLEYAFGKYADAVDEVVYPERLGAILAKNALLGGNIRAIADIARNLQLVELTVTEDSPMKGYTLSELELPANARLLAYGTDSEALSLPDPDTTLSMGDRLVVIAAFDVLDDVRSIVVGDDTPVPAEGGV
ncbi:MAG: TrkA family potassium uptake protein [Haloarculaceae archaeon]